MINKSMGISLVITFLLSGCGHAQMAENLNTCKNEITDSQLCLDRRMMSIYPDSMPGPHLGDPSQSFESVNRPETIAAIIAFRELISGKGANFDDYSYSASVTSSTIYLEANPRMFPSDFESPNFELEDIQRLQTVPAFHALFEVNGVDLIEFDYQR